MEMIRLNNGHQVRRPYQLLWIPVFTVLLTLHFSPDFSPTVYDILSDTALSPDSFTAVTTK